MVAMDAGDVDLLDARHWCVVGGLVGWLIMRDPVAPSQKTETLIGDS
jgi:hypothetical protein